VSIANAIKLVAVTCIELFDDFDMEQNSPVVVPSAIMCGKIFLGDNGLS